MKQEKYCSIFRGTKRERSQAENKQCAARRRGLNEFNGEAYTTKIGVHRTEHVLPKPKDQLFTSF